MRSPLQVLEKESQNDKESVKTSGRDTLYLTAPFKILEESSQNKEESERSPSINSPCLTAPMELSEESSKFKKITPTYIVVKNSGTPIIMSETNLQIAQTASCTNNGLDNKTLDTTLQENKLSIESIVHNLLAQLDQFTNL